jgi:PAS domain S-box-containing protein
LILADEAGALHPVAQALSPAGEEIMRGRVRSTVPEEPGVTGWVARNLRPTLIPDVREDPRVRGGDSRAAESVLAVPLVANGELTGVLRLGALGANRFGESDLRLAEALARQTAVIVLNAQMQERMRQQNESLALMGRLAEASRDAILLVDPLGRIAHCNPAMESLFGFTKSELVGQPVKMLRSSGNLPETFEAIDTALTEVGDWQGEVLHCTSDGTEFPTEVHISTVFGDHGEPIGSVEIVRDLTRRKALEAERVQTEKLSSLGVMAAGVAHEVNNSLASVLGQADLMLRMTHEPQARRCLEAIINAAEDGAGSVRRITEFARPNSDSKFAPVDLAEVAQEVVRATAPRWRDAAARHGRFIDAQADATRPVWVMGTITELREAVTNLVLNAVDAMPQGGSIRVQAQEERGRALLRVSDTGTGMSEEVRKRVFDPFFTTKPFGQGTGLGLALVYGIAERHKGEIRVLSQPGQGTTFEIELDLAEAPAVAQQKPESFAASQGLNILVVEDEIMLGEQLRSILSLDGHSIRVCNSGEEALDALDEEFDLLITDLSMPGIGGKEVARFAKARFPRMPVGVVTGWTGDFADGQPGIPDIDFVVPKPYRVQTIREAVARACPPAVLSA